MKRYEKIISMTKKNLMDSALKGYQFRPTTIHRVSRYQDWKCAQDFWYTLCLHQNFMQDAVATSTYYFEKNVFVLNLDVLNWFLVSCLILMNLCVC